MKNCDPLEFFPVFPMDTNPRASCFSRSPSFSSLNFLPQMDSPPEPFCIAKSPPCATNPAIAR